MATKETQIVISAVDKTKAALSSVHRGLNGVRAAVNSIHTKLLAVGTLTTFAALTKSAFASIDALAKTADKIGVTTTALSGLRHAAELTGVSANTMDMALQRFTRRTAEAAIGTGEAKDALKELGLDARELTQIGTDQAMLRVADAMGQIPAQADKVRLAMKLFDSEGVALVNTLAAGSDGMKEMMVEAEVLGLAVSRIDAAKIEQANDAVTKMQGLSTGLFNQIAVKVAPVMTKLVTGWVDSAKGANGFGDAVDNAMTHAVKIVGVFANGIHGIKVLFQGLVVASTAFADGFWGALSLLDKGVTSLANTIVDGLLYPLRKVLELAAALGSDMAVEGLNAIEGVGVSASSTLSSIRDQAKSNLSEAVAAFQELALTPMPSGELEKWVAVAVKSAGEIAASTTAAAQGGVSSQPEEGTSLPATAVASSIEARLSTVQAGIDAERTLLAEWYATERSMLVAKLDANKLTEAGYAVGILQLRQDTADKAAALNEKASVSSAAALAASLEAGLATRQDGIAAERELFAEWYETEHAALVSQLEAKKLTEAGYSVAITELRQRTADKAVEISRKAAKEMSDAQKWAAKTTGDKSKEILGFLSEQTSGMAKESRKAFELNKAVSLAQALISGYEAVQNAYAWGTKVGGPLGGAAAATLATAATLVQVNGIKNASYQGGGGGTLRASVGSGGGGALTTSRTESTPEQNRRNIDDVRAEAGVTMIFNGPISSNDAERLLEDIKGLVNSGDHVLIEPNSRNGRVLSA